MMANTILKYIFSLAIFSLLGIILLDNILLPNYVKFNNEHYLPDVRGEYFEKAEKLNRGDIDRSNGFMVKADCYNVPISELRNFRRRK